MKKGLIALFLASALVLVPNNANAKKMQKFWCKKTKRTKTCSYGYPQSDIGYKEVTKYRKNGKKEKRTLTYRAPFLSDKIVYTYNKKGQLKSNKYGKAKKVSYKYNFEKEKVVLVRVTEVKYNSKGKYTSSKFDDKLAKRTGTTKYTYRKSGKISKKEIKEYTSALVLKKVYQYNKKGQLKSNKYGEAKRTTYYYKVISKNKSKLEKRIVTKYNSKGKLGGLVLTEYK